MNAEYQFFDNSDGLRRIQRLIGSTSLPVRIDYLQTDVFLTATRAASTDGPDRADIQVTHGSF